MSLLLDLFGYLSIVLHGFTVASQSIAVGGVLFLVLLARPLAPVLPGGGDILHRAARIAAWGAGGLILCDLLVLLMQGAVLVGTVDLSVPEVLSADFARALVTKMVAALCLLLLLGGGAAERGGILSTAALLLAAAVEIAAATLTTHAAARMTGRGPMLAAEALHQLGAAIWIGGLPCFLLALNRVNDGRAWRRIAARYSRMSMVGVACIVGSGALMWLVYVGGLAAFYGTAFGVMVWAKMMLFGALLLLGAGNFLLVRRLGHDPATPVLRMKRFAEVELGIGLTIFFAAASLTSVPPGVDLSQDRVTWHEIVERNAPVMPRLATPSHDDLALPALQQKLDAEAAVQAAKPQPAFVPGSGDLPPRNAADIAWSEYNHHWAGVFVLVIGLLTVANRAGVGWARHWPLLFLMLGVFLLIRSDPEVWPMGHEGVFESLRDVEVLQHRLLVLLVFVFAIFEWRVRAGGLGATRAALVFPLISALGAALLLTHSHAIANIKDQLLIEITHTPLALASCGVGWARWLEIRLDGRAGRIAGWVWPVCMVLIGLILLDYQEA